MSKKRGAKQRDNGFEDHGGYMAAKKAKLAHQFANAADGALSSLFSGVRIFVNGITDPPASQLKLIMQQHGGVFHHYMRRAGVDRTTHVIATNMCRASRARFQHLLVVRPQWISACLESGVRVACDDFLLFQERCSTLSNMLKDQISSSNVTRSPSSDGVVEEAVGDGLVSSSDNDSIYDVDTDYEDDDNVEDIRAAEGANVSTQQPSVEAFPERNPAFDEDIPEICQEHTEENIENSSTARTQGRSDVLRENNIISPISSTASSGLSVTKIAGDPGFLQEYFSNSRLHQISEMKAEFIDFVASLQHRNDHGYPAREQLKRWCSSVECRDVLSSLPAAASGEQSAPVIAATSTAVAHIDLDCFFVSVSRLKKPDLAGVPVAVAHSRRSSAAAASSLSSMSEVACCSYEARTAGVRNGMLLGKALQRCPSLRTAPYDFPGYRHVARAMYSAVAELSSCIEALSCDELLLDCGELLHATQVSTAQLAAFLRQHISRATGGCAVSVGIGPSVLVARMATRRAKPNGQWCVGLTSSAAADFVAAQPLDCLPGVGLAAAAALRQLKCVTCGDLRQFSQQQLAEALGGARLAERVHRECRGNCSRVSTAAHNSGNSGVKLLPARRSISVEVNYGVRFEQRDRLHAFLHELCDELEQRATSAGFSGDRLSLRVMVRRADAPLTSAKFLGHGCCDTVSRSGHLPDQSMLHRCARRLLQLINPVTSDVRGLALQVATSKRRAPFSSNTAAGTLERPESASPRKQMSVDKMFKGRAVVSFPEHPARNHHEPAVNIPVQPSLESSSSSVDEILTQLGLSAEVSDKSPKTLCGPGRQPRFYGCSDHSHISRLIVEWIQQAGGPVSSSPQLSDVRALSRYLSALIDSWQLSTASRQLQLLWREAARLAPLESSWLEAVQQLTEAVQASVRASHRGAQLLLPC